MTNIEKYNQSKIFKFATYFCVVLILFFIIVTYTQYNATKLNLTNPLLPKILLDKLFENYIKKTLTLFIGLLLVLALTFYKKNVFAFALSIIIIAYYILSNFPVPGWHTQLG